MTLQEFRDELKLKLTGDILETELEDSTYDALIKSALREIQRYITSTNLITIPYKRCIDLSDPNDTNGEELLISSVSNVYRTSGVGMVDDQDAHSISDPMYIAQWQMLSGGGNLYNLNNAISNYGSWNTMMQIRNTMSTDLFFKYDKSTNKLYINAANNSPSYITIEYIPKYINVAQITSDYWIDMLMRLATALTKITIGRIRTRFTQSNALLQQDGQIMLDEGNAELAELRQMMLVNSELTYPID